MIEFKQIIGRGTRVREDYGKMFYDYGLSGATELFADSTFDGDPVVIYSVKEKDPIVLPEIEDGPEGDPEDKHIIDYGPPRNGNRYDCRRTDKILSVRRGSQSHQRTRAIHDERGKLITESLKDYTKRNILKEYASLINF